MALWEFSNYNKYNNLRSQIIYLPNSKPLSHGGKNISKGVMVRRFKYEFTHPNLCPSIYKSSIDNKTYLNPGWKEVEEGTTLKDIDWIKQKPKKEKIGKLNKIIIKTKSSNNDIVYITIFDPSTNYYKCSCPGSWRSRGNCKHIKKLKEKL